MSKPRYKWWGYVKDMIRRYPHLCQQQKELHSQSITQGYSSELGGGHGDPRGTESIAIRELPTNAQREYMAVRAAYTQTARYQDGEERLKLVDLVFWRRTHTLQGAAEKLHVSYRTGAQWHGEFIRLVASNYGLLD